MMPTENMIKATRPFPIRLKVLPHLTALNSALPLQLQHLNHVSRPCLCALRASKSKPSVVPYLHDIVPPLLIRLPPSRHAISHATALQKVSLPPQIPFLPPNDGACTLEPILHPPPKHAPRNSSRHHLHNHLLTIAQYSPFCPCLRCARPPPSRSSILLVPPLHLTLVMGLPLAQPCTPSLLCDTFGSLSHVHVRS